MKRTGRKPPTAAQDRYHEECRELGCIISGKKPVHIHHIRKGVLGTGQAVNHWRVLPLHYDYHDSEAAGAISLHGTPKEFTEKYGTELDLERKLKELLNDSKN